MAGEEPSYDESHNIQLGVSREKPDEINDKPLSIGWKYNTADYNSGKLTITKTNISSGIISSLKLFDVGNSSWVVN